MSEINSLRQIDIPSFMTNSRASNNENLQVIEQDKIYKPNGLKKIGKFAIGLAGAVTIIFAVGKSVDGIEKLLTPPAETVFEFDDSIEKVTYKNGANFREDPNTGIQSESPNLLEKLDIDKDITISVDGAYVAHDKNGEWIGVSDEVLKENDIKIKNINNDDDHTVWVNNQKVEVIRSE